MTRTSKHLAEGRGVVIYFCIYVVISKKDIHKWKVEMVERDTTAVVAEGSIPSGAWVAAHRCWCPCLRFYPPCATCCRAVTS